MSLIDVGNFAILVEHGLGPKHAKLITDQWNAKCAEVERLKAENNGLHAIIGKHDLETDRLRTALRRIEDKASCDDELDGLLYEIIAIARDARAHQ